MEIKVSDYINDSLFDAGAEHAFLVTGGMIMHLTDSIVRHGRQKYTCCHHEQSVVMAAEAYGRYTGKLGLAYVTAGPGALNTLTSVVGAFVDSSPCIIVSGQSKVSQAIVHGPRQFAMQGFNTLPIFEKVTKYAVMLTDITKVRYQVERAIYEAKSGRVGPVWLEVPIDIQGTTFDPRKYEGFTPPQKIDFLDKEKISNSASEVMELLQQSKRPLILAGAGIRLSESIEVLHQLLEKTRIPIITSRLGMDIIDHNHPDFVGRPGTYGDRAANFAIQNCDLLINIGCRLGIGLVGYDYQDFARYAKKISIDVDEKELEKPSVIPDMAIKADAKLFLESLLTKLGSYKMTNQSWHDKTQEWKKKYPVDLPEYLNEKEGINSYHFMRVLSQYCSKDDVFVLDTGSCFHVFAQAFQVKKGQRHIITGGLSTMGYTPAVLGVAAIRKEDTYCISGDGSFQFNIQELQTIVQNKLPVKFVVLNNNGYLLIRLTQNNFMEGRKIGIDAESGLSCPDLEKISYAYGIKFIRINNLDEMEEKIKEFQAYKGAVICEVITPAEQLLIPRVASKKLDDGSMISMPYDDMFPFLPREEYQSNCVRDKN
jgi:acetolactate synthase-1/2/3 large subunit